MEYIQAIVNNIFDKYPDNVPCPEYHPLIEYIALKWDSASDKNNFYASFEHSKVAEMCEGNGPGIMGMVDLRALLPRMPTESYWWLLPIAQHLSDMEHDAGKPYYIHSIRDHSHGHSDGRPECCQ